MFDSYFQHLGSPEGIRKYSRNTAWLLTEKAFRLVLGLTVGIWVARYLGPEQFGILSYAISLVAIFASISTMGLDQVLVRDLTIRASQEGLLTGTAWFLRVTGTLIAMAFLWMTSTFLKHNDETNMIVFLASLSILLSPMSVIELYFRSMVRSKYIVWSNGLGLLFGLIGRVFLILSRMHLVWFAVVFVLEGLVSKVGSLLFYHRDGKSVLNWRISRQEACRMTRDSWPLLFSAMMISVYMKIDQVMIRMMLGVEQVGYYSAAVRISEFWYFIPAIVCPSVLPALVSIQSVDGQTYERRFQSLYDLMSANAIAIAVPVSLFAPWLITWLYGNAYSPAGPVLQIHVWACIFVFLGGASANWLLAENLQKILMFNTLGGAVINVVANLVLIPRLSIEGAAIATVLSYAYSAYFGLLLFPNARPVFQSVTRSFFPLTRLVRTTISKD